MPTLHKSLLVPYTAKQMYDLINAIENYPEFLPWCKATEIHSRDLTQLKASIHLSKGPLNHSITTENSMQPHERITMQYIAGPFRSCTSSWTFAPADTQCNVVFSMDYEFTSKLAALAIEPIFNPIAATLIDAFYKRAQQIYAS